MVDVKKEGEYANEPERAFDSNVWDLLVDDMAEKEVLMVAGYWTMEEGEVLFE